MVRQRTSLSQWEFRECYSIAIFLSLQIVSIDISIIASPCLSAIHPGPFLQQTRFDILFMIPAILVKHRNLNDSSNNSERLFIIPAFRRNSNAALWIHRENEEKPNTILIYIQKTMESIFFISYTNILLSIFAVICRPKQKPHAPHPLTPITYNLLFMLKKT